MLVESVVRQATIASALGRLDIRPAGVFTSELGDDVPDFLTVREVDGIWRTISLQV